MSDWYSEPHACFKDDIIAALRAGLAEARAMPFDEDSELLCDCNEHRRAVGSLPNYVHVPGIATCRYAAALASTTGEPTGGTP